MFVLLFFTYTIIMMSKENKFGCSFWIRSITIFMIVISIMLTYYVIIVQNDYIVFSNQNGPDISLEE